MQTHWSYKTVSILFVLLLALVFVPVRPVYAAAIASKAIVGLWNDTNTWVGGSVPGAGDTVTIVTGATITLDISPTVGSLTIQNGATLNTGSPISQNLLVNADLITSGTIQANTSTITVGGAFTMGGGFYTGADSILILNGTVTKTGGTFIPGSVNYGRAGDQTIIGATYLNLSTSGGTSTKTLGAATTINGTLTVGDDTTLDVGPNPITVIDTSTIYGTLKLSSATGLKTFAGNVIIISGGAWNETSAALVSFNGNVQNDGAWTAGTGLHTFSGASKTFSGTQPISIPNVTIDGPYTNNGTFTVGTALTITGVTLTNNGTLTVNSASGTGSGITQGTGATLNINGAMSITTLTATAIPNTVNYTGGSQTVAPVPYHHLNLIGNGTKTLTGVTTINGDLNLGGTASATTAADLTIGGNLSVGAGRTFTVAGFSIDVVGSTTIDGILAHNNISGSKTYEGDVTINGTGTWSETAAAVFSFGGNLHNDGSWTAQTGMHTFSGVARTFDGANLISIANVTISGSRTNNGKLVVSTLLAGPAGSLTQGANSELTIGATTANFTLATLVANASNNTVTYNGGAQVVRAVTYHHLSLSGSGAKDLAGLTTVNGNFTFSGTASASITNPLHIGGNLTLNGTNTVSTGAALTIDGNLNLTGTGSASTTFTAGPYSLSVGGNTTISGVSSTINSTLIFSVGTVPTFHGLVTISPNGVWDNSANVAVTLQGGLLNNSAKVFTAGTGFYTFSTTSAQGIGGSNAITIPNLIVNTGVTLTNTDTLTVSTALSGPGTMKQDPSAILNISGTSTISTLTATANPNTVSYDGGSQTVIVTPYHHLSLGGSGTKTLPAGLTTVAGNLTLSGTASATTVDDLAIGANLALSNSAVLAIGGFDFTVSGTTTLTNTSQLHHNSAAGVKTYTGNVTINSGCFWYDNEADFIPISFGGNLQNNGTLNAGDGVHTFTGAAKTFGGTIIIPNVTINGTYTNNGILTVDNSLAGGGSLTQGTSNPTLNLGGSLSITTLTASANSNTVNYNKAGLQTIRNITYHHLTLSGASTKTLGEAVTVNGNLTINTGTTLDVSASDYAITLRGNWSNSGIFTPHSGTVTMQGGATQTMSGASTFNNLTIDNSSGVTLSANETINSVLTFTLTSGKINTGSNAVLLGTSASIVGADATSYINGNLQKDFATGPQTFVYDIGDLNYYTPLTLTFANITTSGDIKVKTTSGEHPSINTSGLESTLDVNRYWTLTNTGLVFSTYDVVFNYMASDKDGGTDPSIFIAKRLVGSTWSTTTMGTRGPTSTQVTGLNAVGDFAIGQPDVTSPVVSNVSSTNGSYSAGVTIAIKILFNEQVVVTGTPRLALETGLTDRYANYASGSGNANKTLVFNYIVQAGDTSADLDYLSTSSLELNSGTIKDYGGNNAVLTLFTPGTAGSLGANNNVIVDTTAPTVTNVNSTTPDGTYSTGPITITVTFSEVVNVVTTSGTPSLALETGTVDRSALYSSGTGTNTLSFIYNIQPDDSSPDLNYSSTTALITGGGTIRDVAGNNANLTLPGLTDAGSLGTNRNIVIDAISTVVTNVTSPNPDATYSTGNITITVTFNKPVTVVGGPTLTLETGLLDRLANYTGGSGTATLSFTYAIQPGDTTGDLDYLATDSLVLNAGSIRDGLGHNATLTLPAKGGPGSLAYNKNILIDTGVPTVTNVTSTTADGYYNAGDAMTITVTFTESVTVTGTLTLTLETGATDRILNLSAGSGTTTLSFLYTVQAGDTSADLNYVSSNALSLSGGLVRDVSGNDAILTLPALSQAGSLGVNKNIVIDTTAPQTSITGNPPANDDTPVFAFAGDDGSGSGVASFMCKMDNGSYSTCTSGTAWSTLAAGSHTFYVYAIDRAGNIDASPASYTWTLIVDTSYRIFLPFLKK